MDRQLKTMRAGKARRKVAPWKQKNGPASDVRRLEPDKWLAEHKGLEVVSIRIAPTPMPMTINVVIESERMKTDRAARWLARARKKRGNEGRA